MSTVVKDLGAVSAYAYAVEKGYTGTEAEFAELMASYATVGQTAVTAAQTATTKASEAATSATTATNKASEATTAATTATTKAAEAQADADAAALDASQALSAASTATTKATEATTAAATATSAKTDAVAANTAAQSAKTAAQTAQTGAETAAASVQSSAAQIQTNADDISELKEDLTATNAEVTDIRVGADGTTYNSASAAVRGQINNVTDSINANNIKIERVEEVLMDDDFDNTSVNFSLYNADDVTQYKFYIDVVQDGTGTPAPNNKRTISGHDSASVILDSASNTVLFPITVYKGYVDYDRSILIVTHKIVDLASLAWSGLDARSRRYSGVISDLKTDGISPSTIPEIYAEYYEPVANNTLYADTSLVGIALNGDRIYVRTGSSDTPTGKFVYPLKDELVYNIETTKLNYGVGLHSLSANTGKSSVKILRDIKSAINKKNEVLLKWEYGSISASDGANVNSSLNMRTTDIIHVSKGSKLYKNSSVCAINALFYKANQINSYQSSIQILPMDKTEYEFENDCFVRFVLQNPSGIAMNINVAKNIVIPYLFDNDKVYKEAGFKLGILGTRSYLGNAITMQFSSGEVMGIDCFSPNAETWLFGQYNNLGISHFDYFMISHYHVDHVGNVLFLIENGYIDENTTVFLPPDLNMNTSVTPSADWNDEDGPKAMFNAVKPALVECGCTIVYPDEGDMIYIHGVDVQFYNTDHSVYYQPDGEYKSWNYNDMSLACYVKIGNVVFCDTADIGSIAQQRMVDLNTMYKANLYTATHHGWDNGNANNFYGLLPDWINRISPDVVFSEDYSGHDSLIMTKESPMQSWCEASGVPNYRTAINGSMFFHLNESGWKQLGNYSRFIRNDKNWSYTNNAEHIET